MKGRVRLVSPFDRVLFLRKLDPMGAMASRDLGLLAQQARERFYRKGSVIFPYGERPESVHIVVEGRVRTEGAEHGSDELGPEETLGFLSLLARWEEGLEAVAEADTTTLEFDRDDLFDNFEDHFEVLLLEIGRLAGRMIEIRKQTPTGSYLAPAEGIEAPPVESLDLIERLLFLRRGETFQRANTDALIELARHMEEVRLEPGNVLWRRGDLPGTVYALVMGTVRATLAEEGRHFWCGPGYPMGNLEGLARHPHWYEAMAETPVFALRTDTDTFLDVLEDHFAMATDVMAAMASGLLVAMEASRRRARRLVGGGSETVSRPT
jgi:CRP-like cAMP-binding protein